MTVWRLILQSLRFYWRSHLSVVIGAAVGAAVLVGALVVGDSVKYSLKQMALARLGETRLALHAQDRSFRAALADDLQAELNAPVIAALHRPAVATTPDGSGRANAVQVHGIDGDFWGLLPEEHREAMLKLAEGDVFISANLARQLNVEHGDTIVLRMEKPSTLPRDMPLASDDETTVALRATVRLLLRDVDLGRFSLRANQLPPFNAFVSRAWLQKQFDMAGRANMLLVGPGEDEAAAPDAEAANFAITKHWQLADAELELRPQSEGGVIGLRSRRIFIDDPVTAAITTLADTEKPAPLGVLSYFVNEIRLGDRAAPYAVVSAVGTMGGPPSAGQKVDTAPLAPFSGDSITLNHWLADDLGAKPGDTVAVTYYVLTPQRKLIEQTARLNVTAVVPIEGFAADRTLMPPFPGIADAANCRDWKPGMPMDLDRIRDKDEDYWDEYRGTPKAFVPLAAGREMWGNRFGQLTAVRFSTDAYDPAQITAHLRAGLDPAAVGLSFRDVRAAALTASTTGIDFGGLFVGLSFFIVVAAMLLTALLFVFGIEQRSGQVGVLLAVGFTPGRIRRLLIGEGFALAVVGTAIGSLAGLGYTVVVLLALATVWAGAVNAGAITWHAEPMTVLTGALISLVVSLVAMRWALRHQVRRPARELLAPGAANLSPPTTARRARVSLTLAMVLIVAGGALAISARGQAGQQLTLTLFGSGALLLGAGLLLGRWLLIRVATWVQTAGMTLTSLGLRNVARRPGRSLATLSMLACGVFLIVAIQANRQTGDFDPADRAAGTGGFTLFAESQLPVLQDLNDPADRDAVNLDEATFTDVRFVPLRVRRGDDASCLNLNRAQQPQLIGVNPADLGPASAGERHAFTFKQVISSMGDEDDPWELLRRPDSASAVPGIADYNTVAYALGKGVGDVIEYTDERGRAFNVRIVGVVADSILQGNILIAQERFVERFPSASGYEMFLIDAPAGRAGEVSAALTSELGDWGMQVTTTRDRLAAFQAVTNTYLTIFQALGGFGMILGSVGLGVVVLRNALERRGEFALLQAVGFRARALQWLVFSEHAGLLVGGLLVGVLAAAAAVAVAPAVTSIADAMLWSIATVATVLVSGLVWVGGATALAMRGRMLSALQDE